MNFNEFKCLHKKSVSIPALHYWDYVTISNFSFNEYTLSKIFQDNGNNNVFGGENDIDSVFNEISNCGKIFNFF